MDSSILMFFEKMPEALPLYETLSRKMQEELGTIHVKVQKSQIAFSNRHQFAFVWHPSRKFKGRKGVYIVVTFGVSYHIEDGRITAAVEPYPNRWTHHVIVQSEDEIDEELLGWIREAYEFSLRK